MRCACTELGGARSVVDNGGAPLVNMHLCVPFYSTVCGVLCNRLVPACDGLSVPCWVTRVSQHLEDQNTVDVLRLVRACCRPRCMRRMERWQYAVAMKRVHRAWMGCAILTSVLTLSLFLIHISVTVGSWGRGPRIEGTDADDGEARTATEEQLSAVCPVLLTRIRAQGQHRARTMFVGDSTALQVMRVSALCLSTCVRSVSLIEDSAYYAVVATIDALNKRISDVGDEVNIDVELSNGFRWEFRFLKARHIAFAAGLAWWGKFSGSKPKAASCLAAAPDLQLYVMVGAWDMIRPSVQHDGLELDEATTRNPDVWLGALAQYRKTVSAHLAAMTSRVDSLRAQCPNASVAFLAPLLPNCSAPKFLIRGYGVGDRNSTPMQPTTGVDPYRFVRGAAACHARLVRGTGAVLRRAIRGALGGVRVVDVEPLTQHHHNGIAPICAKSDGTHMDDLGGTPLRLTHCGLEVVRLLWATSHDAHAASMRIND